MPEPNETEKKEDCASRAIHHHKTGKVIDCDGREEKTCGNCGWHGPHKYGKERKLGMCGSGGVIGAAYTYDDQPVLEDAPSCHWKPIEPVCDVCGGLGHVCYFCGTVSDKCSSILHHYANGTFYLVKPCPKCSPEKEEQLLVPCKWVQGSRANSCYLEMPTGHSLAIIERSQSKDKFVIAENYGQLADVLIYKLGKVEYNTLDQAKEAVETALGIRKG